MLTGEIRPVALPEELHEATKLTIYVGRQEQVSAPRRSSPSATCCTGAASPARPCCSASTGPPTGYVERARFFGRNADVPMMIIAVGSRRSRSRACCPSSAGCSAPAAHARAGARLQARRRTARSRHRRCPPPTSRDSRCGRS